MGKTTIKHLPINAIRIDGGTQPRAEINEPYIRELAEVLEEGRELPPLIVFHDGRHHWLADGFHRFHAYQHVDRADVPVEVRSGTRRDAVLYSVGANAEHGLRRTNRDKRQAVLTLLEDEEWSTWSDREVARRCAVSHTFVAQLRRESAIHTGNVASMERTYTHPRTGEPTRMNTSNIGGSSRGDDDPAFDGEGEAEDAGEVAGPARRPDGRDQPVDRLGNPITDPAIAAVFADIHKLRNVQTLIQRARAAAAALKDEAVGAYLPVQRIDDNLKEAWTAVKFAMPYALTPGTVRDARYRAIGWMPRDHYDRLPAEWKGGAR